MINRIIIEIYIQINETRKRKNEIQLQSDIKHCFVVRREKEKQETNKDDITFNSSKRERLVKYRSEFLGQLINDTFELASFSFEAKHEIIE